MEYQQNTHSLRLAKFISGAGTDLLQVLEEELARTEGEVVEGLPQRDIDFADSITVLRIEEVGFNKIYKQHFNSAFSRHLVLRAVPSLLWSFLLTTPPP